MAVFVAGSKVGLGKAPPSEGLIDKHRCQRVTHNQWKNDVTTLKDISVKLAKKYQGAKNNFAMNRYEDLKVMIKEAVTDFRKVEQEIKSRPVTGSRTKEEPPNGQNAAGPKKGGLISSLRKNAQNFAEMQGEVAKQEKDYSGIVLILSISQCDLPLWS